MILNLILLLFLVQDNAETTVTVSGIKEAYGTIRIAFYDNPDDFLDDKKVSCTAVGKVSEIGRVTFSIKDCPQGVYAAALYHDVNDNDEMDKTFMGIPKEPYGFSNNVMGTFGAPSFDQAKFDSRKIDLIEITLR